MHHHEEKKEIADSNDMLEGNSWQPKEVACSTMYPTFEYMLPLLFF
jgi:hypothetical protein